MRVASQNHEFVSFQAPRLLERVQAGWTWWLDRKKKTGPSVLTSQRQPWFTLTSLFLLHMVLTSVKEILTWKSCLSENFKRRSWVTACTVRQPWSSGVVHFWGTWDPMCFRPARHMRTFKSTNENWSVELMRFGMAIGSLHVSYTFIWYVCGENTMREWV